MSRVTRNLSSRGWLAALLLAGLPHSAFAIPTWRYVFSSIDYPYGVMTVPYSINNSGSIVGAVAFSNLSFCGKTCVSVSPGWEGFLLSGSTYTPITYPGAGGTVALGIDTAGDIVGAFVDYGGVTHGYLFRGGTYTSVDFPGAKGTLVAGILDNGSEIIGSYLDSNYVQHGFYAFLPSVFESYDVPGASSTWGIDLGCSERQLQTAWAPFADFGFYEFGYQIRFPNAISTVANGTNPTCSTQLIAGYYEDSSYKDHGFVLNFYSSPWVWLTVDVPFSGTTATFAQDVNDSQQVVGYYVASGQTHGFVATRQAIAGTH